MVEAVARSHHSHTGIADLASDLARASQGPLCAILRAARTFPPSPRVLGGVRLGSGRGRAPGPGPRLYREGDLNLILDKGRKEGNTSTSRVNTFRGIYTLYSFVSLQKLTW